ncbi:hypothetical protein DYD21_03455 [Rhodohalobacter sp. SW132]|uniref:FISUMP domain-containing protein n=1 Tax=Rhodohalobacter sp. SW132 TaxID=2293433 RepID=UPI000E26D094|nr:FISUMP domain-containing protein [Rhodohalobacter sp. SW132]REL39025.1 hypothetical protein DYD21_03455 [Rhodohalobacter sp. SW132]
MEKIKSTLVFSILFMAVINISCSKDDEMTAFTDERDGKTYQLFEYGNQVWMGENLNFASDGSWSYENSSAHADEFGRLYNWNSAVNSCPNGWRLPTHQENSTMVDNLGGIEHAGAALKSSEHLGLALGGYRSTEESFEEVGNVGVYWSGTETEMDETAGPAESAWNLAIYNMSDETRQRRVQKDYGFNVRCIQD